MEALETVRTIVLVVGIMPLSVAFLVYLRSADKKRLGATRRFRFLVMWVAAAVVVYTVVTALKLIGLMVR